jgi:hypothetical protein
MSIRTSIPDSRINGSRFPLALTDVFSMLLPSVFLLLACGLLFGQSDQAGPYCPHRSKSASLLAARRILFRNFPMGLATVHGLVLELWRRRFCGLRRSGSSRLVLALQPAYGHVCSCAVYGNVGGCRARIFIRSWNREYPAWTSQQVCPQGI